MRVLITGASGFIGHVLSAQLLEQGHEVHALVRRVGSQPPGTTPLAGDLLDAGLLQERVAESKPDCVVHLAAEIASQRSTRKVMQVNVDGTERLLAACAGSGGSPRVVFASTVVTGDARGRLLDEDTQLPIETPYGIAKQQGERLVADSGLPYAIVRPSHVYGPGGWYAQELIPRLRQPGRFAVIGSGRNLWDVVHVDDVASALVLAATSTQTGSIYHVADDQPITFYDFMALTAEALGTVPPRRIPAAIARLVAGPNAVAAVVRSARSSNEKAKRELGWSLRFPGAREGIADAVSRLGAGA
jgi:nucleoside-diphosphate-sugar epimerase